MSVFSQLLSNYSIGACQFTVNAINLLSVANWQVLKEETDNGCVWIINSMSPNENWSVPSH